MKIHKTKEEALAAIREYAKVMKKASEETGAEFEAEALDDSGMEYYVEACYSAGPNRVRPLKIRWQTLDL